MANSPLRHSYRAIEQKARLHMQQTDIAAWIGHYAARPWLHVPGVDMAPALAVPSMLTQEESQLYHWIGLNAAGCGATIDLGAFAGGSAARLLQGLHLAGKPHHLHAYDRFTASADARARFLSPGGVALTRDENILPLVQRLLAPWQANLTLYPGDIAAKVWSGDPVEILAIDAGKSPGLTDHIAAQFFGALVPGQSLVIHQDFGHATQGWLAVQMQHLAGYFTPLAYVAPDCVVFLCTAPVDAAAIAAARTDGLSDDALIAGILAAADRFAPLIKHRRFDAMIAKVRANPGVRKAWQMRN